MTMLDGLLLLMLASVPLSALLANGSLGRWLLVVSYIVQFALLLSIDPASGGGSHLAFTLLGNAVGWQIDALGWLFAVITIGAAAFAAAYAAGEWGAANVRKGLSLRWLYAGLQVNVLCMMLLLSAGDLIALFIGWELTSWSGVILMLLGGSEAIAAARRYIVYAIAGGMAVFAALLLTQAAAGSLQYADVIAAVPAMSSATVWSIALLFVLGFAVKMGTMPFHLWQAPAYAYSPAPASAFLGSISARMGLFAIALVAFKLIGVESLDRLYLFVESISLRNLLAWVAVFTAILPTFVAMRQNDARLLLGWHGVGQGGYMLLGLIMADSLGSAGGLLHVFNHATYQAILLMAVFAVIHRTGTADLNRLGGLVARMPLSFLAMLIGIIGLAGLPPMNGFVSKWMIYRALILDGQPLLFVATVASTLGTVLSVYKLLHNTFLGQLRLEHEHVSEAPWSMTIPMLLLCGVVFVTGVAPGLVLGYVAAAQQAIGLAPVAYTLGGIESPAGSLDMIWVTAILFAGFGVGAVLFYLMGGRSRRVHQLDNYAGGHFLTADVRYQYSDNFYAGLMHRIRPWYRGTFVWLEASLVSALGAAGALARAFFAQANPAFWVLVGTTIITTWVMWHALV
ncbi:MAG: NADH dehydrogenase subunit [Gammaproteobacteria bacterium]|nr:NADH dehydrogenase subunit [Gammaproteobacteria bacterium]